MTSSNSLAQILARTPLLQGCPGPFIAALAEQSRIVQLPMGQPFQRAGQLPPGVALLLEGRLRRLLSKPGAAPWNLGFVEPGDWVSWSAIWRAEPEVTLTASKPSALVLIPAAVARAALQQEPTLRAALSSPSFEEVAVLMAAHWEQQGLQQQDPLPRLRQLQRESRLLSPEEQLPEGHLIIYSGPGQPGGLQTGERLAPESSQWRQPIDGLPPRVLAVPEGPWRPPARRCGARHHRCCGPHRAPQHLAGGHPVGGGACRGSARPPGRQRSGHQLQCQGWGRQQPRGPGPGLHPPPHRLPPDLLFRRSGAPQPPRCGGAPRSPQVAPGGPATGGPGLRDPPPARSPLGPGAHGAPGDARHRRGPGVDAGRQRRRRVDR
ncbi:hypothetical protein AAF143_15820 [Cyanobium sp. ATX-6F1]